MGGRVRLLGAPQVAGAGPDPRGHKAWGLLAHLLLAPAPVPRARLAALLFPDAEDPAAALRWNLSELRRALADPAALRGDPLHPPPVEADVVALLAADGSCEAAALPEGVLLEGVEFPTCPAFEVWLDAERRHLRGVLRALLREAALSALARHRPAEAVPCAARLVADDPLDEAAQALLVRSLAASGDGVAAARQVAACRELFRRELGVEPGPGLAAAAATVTRAAVAPPRTGAPAVAALVDAGQAALSAGAVDAGLECLRRAVVEAPGTGDDALAARALLALGTALVHSVRGADEEGAAALHRVVTATAGGPADLQAEAARELGYVEYLAGRYDRVETWLARAEAAAPDPAAQARVLTVRGSALSDTGDQAAALAVLEEAVALTPEPRQAAYALAMAGRAHLLRGEPDAAAVDLDRSLELARAQGWTSFLPWPASFRAEVDLARGDLDAAAQRLEHAFALSCQVGDPCWEGVSARGLGLLHAARGEPERAVALLQDARVRATRVADAYLWLDAYVLDALCLVGRRAGLPGTAGWAAALHDLASRTGMRGLAASALRHRAALGDRAAQALSVAELVS